MESHMTTRKWFVVFALPLLLFGIAACQPEIAPPKVVSTALVSLISMESPGNIVIAAAGDIMLGSTYPPGRGLPPEDGATMLKDVTPLLSSADLAFGNLEGPMLEGGTTSKCRPESRSCFAYRVPTRYGKYLKDAGFDVMSVANNHASDFGAEGRESTRRVLDTLGIAHSGGNYDDIPYLNVKGKKIGVIAFAFNNVSYNINDIETARRVVARVKAKADLVIVSFHGGAEGAAAQRVPRGPETYLSEARGDSRAFTHAVVDAGADLVLGSGPHVVRGMEVYRDRLIVYSLGNFAFHGFRFAGPTGLSVVLEVTIGSDGRFLSGLIHPLIQTPEGPRLDKDRTVIPIARSLSTEDFGLSAVKISDSGAISPP
jgi:capsule synthesis protein PGA_cap